MSDGVILDQWGGIIKRVRRDPHTGHTIRHISYDAEPLVENNKRLQNDSKGFSRSRTFRLIGEVDPVNLERWALADGLTLGRVMRMNKHEFGPWVKRHLREETFFRARGGKI